MRRLAILVAVVAPALMLLTASPGCNRNDIPQGKAAGTRPAPVIRTALEVTPDGVLKGKVVYDGEPPTPKFIPEMNQHKAHADMQHCLKENPAALYWPTWAVNKETKGVANVVVWLEPPADRYFALTEHEKAFKETIVTLDQPHCAYAPHVLTLFPAFWDGTKYQKTGQILRVTNSATIAHAVQWDASFENKSANHTVPPSGHADFPDLVPQKKVLPIGCGIHSWMFAYLWIFEHPYHTVTKEDGSFELKNVPTGVELTFTAWHESQVDKPFEKKPMILRKGDNPPLELKIKQIADPRRK